MAFSKAGHYTDPLIDTLGKPVTNTPVTVYARGTQNLATLWTSKDKTATVANPVLSDASGNLSFYADPGYYDLKIGDHPVIPITVQLDPLEVDEEVGNPLGDAATANNAWTGINDFAAAVRFKTKPWVDVTHRDFGAVGDGVNDDLAAINAAITAAGPNGTIFLPGVHRISGTIASANPITLQGANWHGSVIKPDIGITAIHSTAAAPTGGFTVRDLFIDYGTSDNANNLAILIDGGVNGATYWLIDHVRLRGGDNSVATTLGKGIRCNFGLEGVIQNCRIEFFGTGIELDGSGMNQSNANLISGCKVRQNNIGFNQALAQNQTVVGNIIEGNGTGYQKASGVVQLSGNHFENNAGSQIDLTSSAGSIFSEGNFYNFAVTMTGAAHFVSVHDAIPTITNNGTGLVTIVQNSRTQSVTRNGTGPFQVYDRAQLLFDGGVTLQGSQIDLKRSGSPGGVLRIDQNNGFGQILGLDVSSNEAWRIIEAGGDVQVIARGSRPLKLFGGNAERLTVSGSTPGSGQAGILVQVNDGAVTSLRQVTVGAVDSGGAGFRLLRVPN